MKTIKKGRWNYVEINCEKCHVDLTRRIDAYRKVEKKGARHLCATCSSSFNGGRKTHGWYGTPTYTTWIKMKDRCFNQNHMYYKYYGGKGIYVCNEWRLDFLTFLQDMGRRPGLEYSIDRIDSDKPYTKENCRWILKTENTRRARLGKKKPTS